MSECQSVDTQSETDVKNVVEDEAVSGGRGSPGAQQLSCQGFPVTPSSVQVDVVLLSLPNIWLGTVQVGLGAVLLCCSLPAEGGLLAGEGPTAVRTLEVAVEAGSVALRGGRGGGGGLLLDSGRIRVSETRERELEFWTYRQPGVRLRSSRAMSPCWPSATVASMTNL